MTTNLTDLALPAPTHRYTATEDVNGDPNPFCGLPVTVLKEFGMAYSGFNSYILVHVKMEDLASRLTFARDLVVQKIAKHRRAPVNAKQASEWFQDKEAMIDYVCETEDVEELRSLLESRSDWAMIEANVEDELSPIREGASR